jgi:hypothetical protein
MGREIPEVRNAKATGIGRISEPGKFFLCSFPLRGKVRMGVGLKDASNPSPP